jgi:CBS domain containing-hemolysin-like protein
MPTTKIKLKLKTIQSDPLPIPGADPWYVTATDPAILVMIDYRSRSSVTIPETSTIDDALVHLKHTGVRCAFVVDQNKKVVVGMITAHDILGEKPQQHMRLTSVDHNEVLVKDIMQKLNDWRIADIKDLEQSTVGDLLEVFNATGMSHLPVIERTENNEQRLRGLLSFSKVKRLLVV